jgi:hypothetical protein
MSSTLSHNRHDFRVKKNTENQMSLSGLSLQFLSEISHSNGRIRRDTFVMYEGVHVTYPLFLSILMKLEFSRQISEK